MNQLEHKQTMLPVLAELVGHRGVAPNFEQVAENAWKSLSSTSKSLYRSVWDEYMEFLSNTGRATVQAADYEALSAWIEYRRKAVAARTVKQYLSRLISFMSIISLDVDTKTRKLLFKRLGAWEKSDATTLRQMDAFTMDDLREIVNATYTSGIDARLSLRDRCAFLLGFAGGFRVSELCNLYRGDIRSTREHDGRVITMRRVKAGSRTKQILRSTDGSLCPVEAIDAVLSSFNGGDDTPLFRPMRIAHEKPMSTNALRNRFNYWFNEVGLSARGKFNAHSLRVSRVTQLARCGNSAVDIGGITGQAPKTVERYTRTTTAINLKGAAFA